jgi:hypothetical protein
MYVVLPDVPARVAVVAPVVPVADAVMATAPEGYWVEVLAIYGTVLAALPGLSWTTRLLSAATEAVEAALTVATLVPALSIIPTPPIETVGT